MDPSDSGSPGQHEQEQEHSGTHLFDLPAEIRVQIYSYLLPNNLLISFERHNRARDTREPESMDHIVYVSPPDQPSKTLLLVEPPGSFTKGFHIVRTPMQRAPKPQTQLFYVNKLMSSEARGVLYSTNTYEFSISGISHTTVTGSMASDLIFGPFSVSQNRLPLLRNLRSIRLVITLDTHSHWAKRRHAARVEHFISVLKQHADDDAQRSLLKSLSVHMAIPHTWRPRNGGYYCTATNRWVRPIDPALFMFGLEALTKLRGVEQVCVTGVPEWFATCLELCVQGKSGDVKKMEWPIVEVTKKVRGRGKRTKVEWVSTRKWWMPQLNWVEFAERNEVELPADVSKYWTDQQR